MAAGARDAPDGLRPLVQPLPSRTFRRGGHVRRFTSAVEMGLRAAASAAPSASYWRRLRARVNQDFPDVR